MAKRKGVPVQVWLPEDTVRRMNQSRALLERPVTRPEYSGMPSRKLFLQAAIEALAGRVQAGEDVSGIPGFKEAGVKAHE